MGRTITKEEIAKYEVEEFSGRIIVINTLQDTEKAVRYLSEFKVIGFDTETRPAFKKGSVHSVALIQLSTNDTCFLFRIHNMEFPAALAKLLADPNILKIGLSLRDDFISMGRKMRFEPQGFIDIQNMVKDHNISDTSLQKVYALLFQKKISKSQRLTNWEADILTESQQKYAALDAWACLKIHEKLCPTKKRT